MQGLKKVAVGSYVEIEARTNEGKGHSVIGEYCALCVMVHSGSLTFNILGVFPGTSNRTVAATQMNATSSRAHTVVTIQFDQIKKNDMNQETKKSSVINLVDLAGTPLNNYNTVEGITAFN